MLSLIRHPKDFWTGVIYVAFGLVAIVIGRDYEMGVATKMGPAYFPTVLGGLLVLIGFISMVRAFFHPGEPIGKFAYRQLFLVLGAAILFGALIRTAGLVIAVMALVLVSAYASVKFGWGHAIALAAALAGFSALVFVKALGLPIPLIGSWIGG